MIVLAPLFLLVAIAVKLSSPGPVLFRQERYGFNNEIFIVYKFRTMYVAEGDAPVVAASKGDARVTKVGWFLRRTSLDELAQFINVINGTMSIVGPRPHAISHNVDFGKVVDGYFARHNVKPGITGWAQVNGHRGEANTIEKLKVRVEHDLYYIDHWSLGFDLKVVFLTAFKVWFHKNAY
jgi:putative colanic acid biosysnthesis UDP-glucose lipid carrier transferase